MNAPNSILSAVAASVGLLINSGYATGEGVTTPADPDVHLEIFRHAIDGLRVVRMVVDGLDVDLPEIVPAAPKSALTVLDLDYGPGSGVVVLTPAERCRDGRTAAAGHRWTVRYAVSEAG